MEAQRRWIEEMSQQQILREQKRKPHRQDKENDAKNWELEVFEARPKVQTGREYNKRMTLWSMKVGRDLVARRRLSTGRGGRKRSTKVSLLTSFVICARFVGDAKKLLILPVKYDRLVFVIFNNSFSFGP